MEHSPLVGVERVIWVVWSVDRAWDLVRPTVRMGDQQSRPWTWMIPLRKVIQPGEKRMGESEFVFGSRPAAASGLVEKDH